ncbi:D-2-hydroxyacid dehydrogenase [Heliophilum fasciatum]|uniref:Phosphoglycerate dehydrogenase-like enzyme n=1 Tax=Heliophilum fasciatum TaxID=35700 RepID=A0A4R2RZ87_9FIRM|nr:D-2-hydroxyacid dehydrogenase [Heliophilum fasciatum]MCW2277178.1 phosphoglycerate dehydrogenase-like enzyme [Heliophilum fasciatum]TCP68187.1 phosphoglycerate dehydrogenase-like enzyme [Heliophilum fasciatum]
MKILMTTAISDLYRERLERAYPGVQWRICRSTSEAMEFLPRTDVLVTYGQGFTVDHFRAAEKLRWIHSLTSGLETFPFDLFREREIALTNVRGIHGVPVAEHVFGMMISFMRQFPFFTRMQEHGRWEQHVKFDELFEKTICVVGLGAIGKEVVKRAQAFGMRIVGVNTDGRDVNGVHKVYPADQLKRALSEADFIVVCVPLTANTENMIGPAELDVMKKSAILVNVARGLVVDERALIWALEEGRIGGAALDVFVEEPLSSESPLWRMHNVVITPHIAGRTPRYMERAMEMFEANLAAFLDGKPFPFHQVDLEKGY